MNQQTALPAQPDYGIDAPRELRRNALYGAAGVGMGALLLYLSQGGALGIFFGVISLISGILLCGICVVMLWGSKLGKLRVRDQVIQALPWRGDEQVLDVGCGHGLMLIAAAGHLTTGRAFGIDMWLDVDQADNSPEATHRNAVLEGVANKVEIRKADARDLPYNNNTFDVVLSSWVIHNLLETDERTEVLREMTRVLKPGGRLVIIDIERVDEYVRFLRNKDWNDITKSRPYFLFVTPTYVLTATKPK